MTVNEVGYQQNQLPFTGWYDSSTFSYAYQSPISGSGQQDAWTSTNGLGQSLRSNTFTLGSAGTLTGTYITQYQLTINLNGYGSSTPVSGSWENSGSVVGIVISSDSSNSSTTRHLLAGFSFLGASDTLSIDSSRT